MTSVPFSYCLFYVEEENSRRFYLSERAYYFCLYSDVYDLVSLTHGIVTATAGLNSFVSVQMTFTFFMLCKVTEAQESKGSWLQYLRNSKGLAYYQDSLMWWNWHQLFKRDNIHAEFLLRHEFTFLHWSYMNWSLLCIMGWQFTFSVACFISGWPWWPFNSS